MMIYIESKPGIANGELVIKGTRIRITQVVRMLLSGRTIENIHTESWPWLSKRKLRGAVKEALGYMNASMSHDKATL
jgi:uncharacterized protein (DUF433 family)